MRGKRCAKVTSVFKSIKQHFKVSYIFLLKFSELVVFELFYY